MPPDMRRSTSFLSRSRRPARPVRAMILLGLAFSLVACDRADSRRYEADMPMKSVPQGDQCPDLAGTYAFEPRSAAERFLVPTRFGNQHFSLLRIESWSDSGYRFTVKASREAFDAAVAELAAHDPKRHREWQELLDERERVIKANKLPRVSDESIAALGPLPEMARNVSRQACYNFCPALLEPVQMCLTVTHRLDSDFYKIKILIAT